MQPTQLPWEQRPRLRYCIGGHHVVTQLRPTQLPWEQRPCLRHSIRGHHVITLLRPIQLPWEHSCRMTMGQHISRTSPCLLHYTSTPTDPLGTTPPGDIM
ncbi:unnamed protein product [Meganyctiphanes norvegica]|uniref:Uncharacterized protein n=1 Tax=Meganyctiphanes norvegica TaxID=48144 RepID=A0AAV2SRU8_MEGNR